MGVRTRGLYVYESDDGNSYSVSLADDEGAETGFGWAAATDEPSIPKGITMRYAILHDPTNPTRQVKRAVATVAAARWTAPLAAAVAVDQFNDAADVSMMVSSLHGEKRSFGVRPIPV